MGAENLQKRRNALSIFIRGGGLMKRYHSFWIIIVIFIGIVFLSCGSEEAFRQEIEQADRESIFDRVVHIEPEIITEIPDVPRWCDQLELKKKLINVGDCELYVEEEGSGMPLVLINGGPGGTHHYFHPWFSKAKGYARVIYYDQRGCGLSDYYPGENGYSVEQAVGDLDAIRKALNIDKWVVLGYSYGGFLAQYYTLRYPERVAGLVLMGSSTGMWIEMGRSRQQEFISDQERSRMREIRQELRKMSKENDWPYEKYLALVVYNSHLNGDWKRQNYYKPSRERVSQMALYEWVHDKNNFRGMISSSQHRVNLTGAFANCPIPTLITEGRWDLTWNTDKPEILHKNHPGSELVWFEKSSHGIYEEEPDKFFKVLKKFIKKLPEVSSSDISVYENYVVEWNKKRKEDSEYKIRSVGWGRKGSEKLASDYSREWIVGFTTYRHFLRVGFALYDVENYEEALHIFEKMRISMKEKGQKENEALSLIWQGHMLDLLGKRKEAIALYSQAADMNIDDVWRHSQYGLNYAISPYARERMKTPFKRIENQNY